MQWGQIKALFIICFLVLNVFLIKQLVDRQEEELSFIPEASKEEELELNINGLESLSTESFTAPLLYVENFNYNEVEPALSATLVNQEAVVVNDFHLYSRFTAPIPIDPTDTENLQTLVNEHVFRGQTYQFFDYLEGPGLLVFFQQYEYPIFYNPNAVLFIQLNDQMEMTQYTQTRLDQIEEDEEEPQEQTLIQQYDAVYRLYHNSSALETNDTITDVQLGFHNLASLPNGEQLLNPTWQIEVNENEDYYVNAVEGHDYPRQTDFIADTLEQLIDQLNMSSTRAFSYYNIDEDREEDSEIISVIRQPFVALYQKLAEVESE